MQPLVIIGNILLVLDALVLIVAVLMQQGSTQNLGVIGGGAETFFGKNKARSVEGKLETITKIAAGVFIALAIATTAMTSRLNETPTASVDQIPVEDTADGATSDDFEPIAPELISEDGEADVGAADGDLQMEVVDVDLTPPEVSYETEDAPGDASTEGTEGTEDTQATE